MSVVGNDASGSGQEDATPTAIVTDRAPAAASGSHEPRRAAAVESDRYLVIEEVGRGGMGRVLRAYDPKLQREVALKVLHTEALSMDAQAMLVREARAMAKLSHPSIVAVYDVELDSRRVMVVMEYVPGFTLRTWLRQAERSWREVLDAFALAGQGLAAAHAAGVLHRDFKPSNVLIQDGRGASEGAEQAGVVGSMRVRVTDFGLAHISDAGTSRVTELDLAGLGSQDDDGSITRAGDVMGTPRYMAPEQHAGEAVDARADQYAFCVALWEALTGEPPFARRSSLLAAKREGPPDWPRKTAVPRPIQDALRRGLSPDPDERWPSMGALLTALQPALTSKSKSWTIGVGLVGIAAVAGAFGWQRIDEQQRIAACERDGATIDNTWNASRRAAIEAAFESSGAHRAADVAQRLVPWLDRQAAAWSDARTELCLSSRVEQRHDPQLEGAAKWCLEDRRLELEALVSEFQTADAQVVHRSVTVAADLPRVDRCLDPSVLRRQPEPPAEHREAVEQIRHDLFRARGLRGAGRYESGLEAAKGALARGERVGWGPMAAQARVLVGELLGDLGRHDEARTALEEAYFEAVDVGAHEAAQSAALSLADTVGLQLARPDEGRRWARHARTWLPKEPRPLDRARHLSVRASLAAAEGAFDRARSLLEEALQLREQTLGSEHPALAGTLNNLAVVFDDLGEYQRAEALYEKSLSLRERALGPEHPSVASSLNNLALVHEVLGETERAETLHARALEIFESALGRDHPLVAVSSTNLASLAQERGAYDAAAAHYERALAILERAHGPSHQDVASVLGNLGILHQSAGQLVRARDDLERALAILEAVRGPDHPEVARVLTNLGNVHLDQGELATAKQIQERALQIREASLPADHPDIAMSMFNLARVHEALGALDQAKPLFERSLEIREEAWGPDHPLVASSREALAELSAHGDAP